MIPILLCVKVPSVKEHWQFSLAETFENVTYASSEKGVRRYLDEHPNAILLLHVNFFDGSIKEYLRAFKETYAQVSIMVLSDTPNIREGKKLLPLGIKGYGNSRLSAVHLIQAVNLMRNGHTWMYPDFIQGLLNEIADQGEQEDVLDILTKREKEVAMLVAKGLNNKDIAQKADLSESTVKTHLRSIFEKLDIHDRVSLALLCQ